MSQLNRLPKVGDIVMYHSNIYSPRGDRDPHTKSSCLGSQAKFDDLRFRWIDPG